MVGIRWTVIKIDFKIIAFRIISEYFTTRFVQDSIPNITFSTKMFFSKCDQIHCFSRFVPVYLKIFQLKISCSWSTTSKIDFHRLQLKIFPTFFLETYLRRIKIRKIITTIRGQKTPKIIFRLPKRKENLIIPKPFLKKHREKRK